MSSERAWNDVRRDVAALGERLRQRYDAGGELDPDKRAHLEAAVEGLGRAVTDVFDSLGRVLDDPNVRRDSSKVAQSLSEAVATTFREVSRELQKGLQAPPTGPSPHTRSGARPEGGQD